MRLLAAISLAATLVTACSNATETGVVPRSTLTTTSSTSPPEAPDESTTSTTIDVPSDFPDGFPLPVPAGYLSATAIHLTDDAGTSYSAIVNLPADRFGDVSTWYEEWLSDSGFDVKRTDVRSESVSVSLLSGEREDAQALVNLTLEPRIEEPAGTTVITMTWTPAG